MIEWSHSLRWKVVKITFSCFNPLDIFYLILSFQLPIYQSCKLAFCLWLSFLSIWQFITAFYVVLNTNKVSDNWSVYVQVIPLRPQL